MYTGTNKYKNQRCNHRVRNTDFRLKPLGILGIALVDALKRTGRDLSTDAFLKALNSTRNFKGLGPRITWTPTEHYGAQEVQIWQCGANGTTHLLQSWTRNDLGARKK